MIAASPAARRFAALYVLAMFGAFIAFVPLAPLILPAKIAAIAGIGGGAAQVEALSWLMIAGGIMAAVGNIGAGHLSDRIHARDRHRRRVIAAGLAAVMVALALLAAAQSFVALLIAVLAFQLALNLLLSPLVALMVDHIDDAAKGMMAGWLGLALPVGSLAVALLTALPPIGSAAQIGVIAAMTALLTLPLILFWPRTLRDAAPGVMAAPLSTSGKRPGTGRNFALAWTARLLIQFAAAAILPYLYYYVAHVVRPPGGEAAVGKWVGGLALTFTIASILSGVMIGSLSDRVRHRQRVLAGAAFTVAAGMAGLASVTGWPQVVGAYAVFAAGLAGFLAVDSALVAQLVSASDRRATLLGIMNLTNTLPGVLAPSVTLVMVGDVGGGTAGHMATVLLIAAGGAMIAALCAAQIRMTPRRPAAG